MTVSLHMTTLRTQHRNASMHAPSIDEYGVKGWNAWCKRRVINHNYTCHEFYPMRMYAFTLFVVACIGVYYSEGRRFSIALPTRAALA